jgi:hypothetical protein
MNKDVVKPELAYRNALVSLLPDLGKFGWGRRLGSEKDIATKAVDARKNKGGGTSFVENARSARCRLLGYRSQD